jgi:hypothetical protein
MPGTRVATPAVIAGENAKISDVVPEQLVKHNQRCCRHNAYVEPMAGTLEIESGDLRVRFFGPVDAAALRLVLTHVRRRA